MASKKSIEAALDALKSGSSDGLKVIFEEYQAYCINTLVKKMGCSVEDAEDIFIDAVLNFRQKYLEGKVKGTNIRAYLVSTCINMQRNQSKARQKTRESISEVQEFLYATADDGLEAYNEKLLRWSQASLAQLSEQCRMLMIHFYVEGSSLQEIAKKFKLANANVAKTTKARCYAKWKHLLDEFRKKEGLS